MDHRSAVVAWVRAARERDVEKMVSLYDPEVRVDGGRVLASSLCVQSLGPRTDLRGIFH